ncbi:MAG: CoA transferase [Dehalococcoidia bacterium]
MVGKRLAALGADVIKIGSTRHPDALRTTPTPRPPGSEVNGEVNWLFANLNAGKRSISLDLASERGRALFLQLVERAEVMLDSYGIDPLPKFRLTYEDLIDVKPDLVMLRSTVMGRRGPCGNTIATGSAIASAGGLTGLTGYPDDDPCGTGTAHPDYSSSAHLGLVATLAALVFRNRTGRGIEIDFSQVEGVASFLGAEFLREQAGDVPLGPEGNRRDGCLVHGVFPGATSDDWCAIAVATEDGWQRLLARVEADDPVLAEGLRAAADPDLRDRLLAGWTVRFRSDELAGTLRQADVLADEVLEAPDLLTNP